MKIWIGIAVGVMLLAAVVGVGLLVARVMIDQL